MPTLSTKPYLLRAIYEWCADGSLTPYIMVKVDANCQVPLEFVRNGEIVLNISAIATNNLVIKNDLLTFSARFGGVSQHIFIPIHNVLAIYAKENGQGMFFDPPTEEELKAFNKVDEDDVDLGPTSFTLTGVKDNIPQSPLSENDKKDNKKGTTPTLTRIK